MLLKLLRASANPAVVICIPIVVDAEFFYAAGLAVKGLMWLIIQILLMMILKMKCQMCR